MRILHTSDWHLGHAIAGIGREHEHARFLAWLIDTLAAEAIDALVITGDVFDASNPPASAERMWFGFLADLRVRLPRLEVVVIAGNHDSAARLEAPRALLERLAVHVVGALPRTDDDGAIDLDRLLVPLHDAGGRPAALVAAVPFLRPADLGAIAEADLAPGTDPMIEGVRRLYRAVVAGAAARLAADQALVVTGHLYMTGTALSHLSERRILGGNQHALPHDLFPAGLAYVALGHLHKAQRVGADHVRYAGSPLPLSLDEAGYRHSVAIAELDGARPATVRTLPVPRAVDVLRVPAEGAAPLAEVLAALATLPAARADDPARPWLAVHVALPAPVLDLRRQLEAALAGKRPRLVQTRLVLPGDGRALADGGGAPELKDVDPTEVLRRRWRRDHAGDPPAELVALYEQLVDEVRRAAPSASSSPSPSAASRPRIERERAPRTRAPREAPP